MSFCEGKDSWREKKSASIDGSSFVVGRASKKKRDLNLPLFATCSLAIGLEVPTRVSARARLTYLGERNAARRKARGRERRGKGERKERKV